MIFRTGKIRSDLDHGWDSGPNKMESHSIVLILVLSCCLAGEYGCSVFDPPKYELRFYLRDFTSCQEFSTTTNVPSTSLINLSKTRSPSRINGGRVFHSEKNSLSIENQWKASFS